MPLSLSRFPALLAGFCVVVAALRAEPAIPEAEALNPPSSARLASIHAAAQREGWRKQSDALRAAAMLAYERGKMPAAETWFHVFRWSTLFRQMSHSEFGRQWVDAVNLARVGHANLPRQLPGENRPLGAALSPELQAWLIGTPAFSEEFFALLSPVDYLPEVFAILNELHRREPAKFKTFASLALAIAVVYDLPPPPFWPHGQVPESVLPRKFSAPADAFDWWTKQDRQGRTYHRLARLGADELKFVVDATAPFPELEWAQTAANQPLGELARAYSMIRYRTERAANGIAIWPGRSYQLKDILAAGGICSDQAYFATQVGKARGVPTLLFYGPGNDGRHAWFGFLDANQKWQLDAGRYAEQRFITGHARDPQTWDEFSDHELQFLSERFRNLPSFRQSRLHAAFAAEYLAGGDAPAAIAAARRAVNYERRNQFGWEILVLATQKNASDPKPVETVLREAALAFQRYPDLEANYVRRVSDSLRARGQTSAAEAELRRIARKNEGERSDLSIQQARVLLQRAMTSQALPEQIRTYNSTVDNLGRGAGVGFFDEIVVPFVEHLMSQKKKPEALRALERARERLKVEPNSQLEAEMRGLEAAIRAAK